MCVLWCPEGASETPLVSGDRRGSVPLVVSCVSSTADSTDSLSSGSSSITPSRFMVSSHVLVSFFISFGYVRPYTVVILQYFNGICVPNHALTSSSAMA